MSKTIVALLVIGGILGAGVTGAYATSQVAKAASITEDMAIQFACVDAGVNPQDVLVQRTNFDFEQGQFVYEVDFLTEDSKYEYTLKATDGSILGKEKEVRGVTPGNAQPTAPANETPATPNQGNKTPSNGSGKQPVNGSTGSQASGTASTNYIGVDRAKEIALADAGMSANQVVFTKAIQDRDDGRVVYEVEFYVTGQWEFDYDIDASSGAILARSKEAWELEDQYEVVGPTQPVPAAPAAPSNPTPSNPAPSNPAPSAPSGTTNVSGDDYYKVEDGTVYEYDDGRWEAENDKKVENGTVYEYDDGRWEVDNDDYDDHDDHDDHDDDRDDWDD